MAVVQLADITSIPDGATNPQRERQSSALPYGTATAFQVLAG